MNPKEELRKILAWLTDYKGLEGEKRAAKADKFKSKLARAKDLEAEIIALDEADALLTRSTATTNGNEGNEGEPASPGEGGRATVQDQPIYRSRFPLGEQLRDIHTIQTNSAGAPEARARWDSMIKREEVRAAGTGMIEAVGQDGGLLLQGETSVDLMTKGFNNSQVLKRTSNRTTQSQFVDIIQIDESDSMVEGSRGGGVRVYTDKELALLTSSKTKFRKLRIEPKRLTGLYYATEEILRDVPMLEGEMSDLFTKEFARKKQQHVVRGNGAGQALGILNSPAIVIVAKESGQTAKTIVRDNLVKMISRVYMANLLTVAWYINQDTLPQLATLTEDVGTGGSVTRDFIMKADPDNGSIGTLFGYPVIPIEQCSTLGTKGDIVLADLAEYITADKGGVDAASSIHVKFEYAQSTFRFLHWFDGQPMWKKALTPENGTATVAPTVVLAARS